MAETVVCLNCGFNIRISPFYAKLRKEVRCPVCDSPDQWKAIAHCTDAQRTNELWKKLIYSRYPDRFKYGKFEYSTKMNKILDWLNDVERQDPKIAAIIRQRYNLPQKEVKK